MAKIESYNTDSADMALNDFNTQIVLPDDLGSNPLASENAGYNVHITTAKPSSINIDKLIYDPEFLHEDYVAPKTPLKKATSFFKGVGKFTIGYLRIHRSHPVLMLFVDMIIAMNTSFITIGYRSTIYAISNAIYSFSTSPIVSGICAVIVIIYVLPFIIFDVDDRSPEEKREDERIDHVLDKVRHHY